MSSVAYGGGSSAHLHGYDAEGEAEQPGRRRRRGGSRERKAAQNPRALLTLLGSRDDDFSDLNLHHCYAS